MPSPEQHQPRIERKDREQEQDPVLELAERLHLEEQYLAQVKVLYRSGLLENFQSAPEDPPQQVIAGVDGRKYGLPAYEDLLKRLQDPEKRKIIEQKAEQGLTRLLLVPFALPLKEFIRGYKNTLLKINRETGIKATDGSILELNVDEPFYVWEDLKESDNPGASPDKQLEYRVKNYDGQTKAVRGGKYKSELLQTGSEGAWQVLLLEDLPDLPAQGQGKTAAGRKQLEANESARDYLKRLQTDPQYQGEQGLTPEAQLCLALTYLQERQTAIDDWQGQGKINLLVGSYLSGSVPNFYWGRDYRRPYLRRYYPGNRNSDYGCRPAARF